MARYFFNLDECGSVTRDLEGVECANLPAARDLAIRSAREMMCAEIAIGKLCLGCRIDIRDDRGAVLLQVPFREAVQVRDGGTC